MSTTKKWIIAAVVMLVAGVLICGITFANFGLDLHKLSTVEYVTNTYEVKEDFRNITFKADTEDITLIPSSDDTCKVVCLEEKDDPHQVSVQGDTLTICRKEKQKIQFFNIGIITESPKIEVYLPNDKYQALSVDADTSDVNIPKNFSFESISVMLDTGDIKCQASVNANVTMKTETGNITISEISASEMKLASETGRMDIKNVELSGNLEIREETGRVDMENVTCRNLTSHGDTGKIALTNVVASGELNIERSTGDVRFNGCDAETIYVRTDTGDVTGSLLSDKVFITDTDTGSVEVPKTITGGRCEITTDTGDIKISVE